MVQTSNLPRNPITNAIDIDAWLDKLSEKRPPDHIRIIRNACTLSQLAGEEYPTLTGESCLAQGLAIAEILEKLHVDHEAIAAAIVYDCVQYADLQIADISEQLGENVAHLVEGVDKMEAIRDHDIIDYSSKQIDNLRKMIIAMVRDSRVALIKLAEITCIMRAAGHLGNTKKQQLAQETINVYAPLASRLGLSSIKWELEDLAFHFMNPQTYKQIAKQINQRRVDREAYVKNVIKFLDDKLQEQHIENFEIQGRAKHIYSIHKKMQRKNVSFSQVYDAIALRVVVDDVNSCYSTLGLINKTWEQIAEEFDDYIAKPKPNGYQSIHCAVVGPESRNVEIQIRTKQMHEDCEMGVAAHWRYKEGSSGVSKQEDKIAWLRQLIEWQQDFVTRGEDLDKLEAQSYLDERIYVFTPTGDIVDLPAKATPLDFAYHVHSEVGHRCRGAKVNGKMVQLTHELETGDQVEIVKTNKAQPSRDWLNASLGYVKSSRARAKIHHWFKYQNREKNVEDGKELLDQEFKRLSIRNVDIDELVTKLKLKTSDELYIGIACGDIKTGQIVNRLTQKKPEENPQDFVKPQPSTKAHKNTSNVTIQGVGNLLTSVARCCKPVPGDSIIGFITHGRGVSIHRSDCSNILHATEKLRERLIEVEWSDTATSNYPIDLHINAFDRKNLLKDIIGVCSNEKINLINFQTKTNHASGHALIELTVEIDSLENLGRVIEKLNQIKDIVSVVRKV